MHWQTNLTGLRADGERILDTLMDMAEQIANLPG
ncbi:Uncharacterised protein [Grimontia hollisae]|nr:Uncharacterised protein [Grimontia hollisae]